MMNTIFPAFDAAVFEETAREQLDSDSGVSLSFVTYTRRATKP